MIPPEISFRRQVRPADAAEVRRVVVSTGFFNEEEVEVAVELVDERLAKGERSGYYFVFAEQAGRFLGYACFGPIPGSATSHDLYWIVVDDALRGQGLGRKIMAAAEADIGEMGGRRVWVDTSSRDQYAPTRAFYERCGYRLAARLEEFYAPGDDKVIFQKTLA